MKLAIIGYGKMGKSIEQVAKDRGYQIQILSPKDDLSSLEKDVDCAIEFTHATVAPGVIKACIDLGKPIISGTTGWSAQYEETTIHCLAKHGAMLWSPNFSIGMNIVFELNKFLATIMNKWSEYDVEVLEAHHTEKKDAPSGTAIALAQQILTQLERKNSWRLKETDLRADELGVIAERIPDVKGIHRVTYKGPHDVISLRHKALSRDAFALGAVISAEWIIGKQGVFTFSDVLGPGYSPK